MHREDKNVTEKSHVPLGQLRNLFEEMYNQTNQLWSCGDFYKAEYILR